MTSHAFDFALDALDVVREAGLTVAPLYPSESMIAAGAALAGITPDMAEKLYRVMLEVAAEGGSFQ
jgi:hypothetical protein